MKFLWIAALALTSSLFCAQRRIEVSLNGALSEKDFRTIFEEAGQEVEVTLLDLKNYPKLFKEKGYGKQKFRRSSTVPVDPKVSHLLFLNIPTKLDRGIVYSRLPKEKMVLFMFEPPLRLRKMYSKKIQQSFSRIYTFDDDLVDNKKYFKFYYPVLRPIIEEVVPFEQKKLCCMVVGRTSDLSKYPEELYSEREKAIRFFEEKKEKGFDLYGKNWNREEHPSYLGVIPGDKIPVMKHYRFALTYENTRGIKGYITEKIFDAFAAGCVPIYWGASNIEEYIPKSCFIDRRDFESMEALYTFMKTMPRAQYERYLDAIYTYLKSEQAQKYSWNTFKKTMLVLCQT